MEKKIEEIREVIRALPAPKDSIVVDGETISITWTTYPKDGGVHAHFAFSTQEGIQGHILSLYSDCRDYKKGTATERTFRWVEEQAPHLINKGKLDENFISKLGAAEFKADQARLTEENKSILKAGEVGLRRSLEKEGIPLSSFTGLEQGACHFAKLICRRGVVELALQHYKDEGEVHPVAEYRTYTEGIADKVLEFLLAKTDQIPNFEFRYFPQSVKGNSVTILEAEGKRYLFDRKTLEVYPRPKSGEDWRLKVGWCDYGDWGILEGEGEDQEVRDPENKREESIIEALNSLYPNNIREDW